jgi:hypothetical protein
LRSAPLPLAGRAPLPLSASRAGLRRATAAARPAGRPSCRAAVGACPARSGLSSCLMDPAHQVVRQLRGSLLCLLGDVPCLTPQRAACAQQVHSSGCRGEQEPARTNPSLPVASSLRGVGDVRKSLCEIDQSVGEPIDISHFRPLLSSFEQ